MDTQSTEYRARLRAVNDQFRRHGIGRGSFMHTDGVHEKGQVFVQGVLVAVRDFDAFSTDNDPYGEHDFGALDYEGGLVTVLCRSSISLCHLGLECERADAAQI